jgi:hypothetical protein
MNTTLLVPSSPDAWDFLTPHETTTRSCLERAGEVGVEQGMTGSTTIQEGDVYRAAHTTRRRTTITDEVDDAMGIKAKRAERTRWRAGKRLDAGV